MARNEEKQRGGLNRIYLQKQQEEYAKLNPKRPKLENLDSLDEIKKWLPSIKRDIDFYLKKSEVVCYSDEQITESRLMVSKLEREFKSFLRKIRQLKPTIEDIPWTSRAYKSNNEQVGCQTISPATNEFIPIDTPILKHDEVRTVAEQKPVLDLPFMNLPLEFVDLKRKSDIDDCNSRKKIQVSEKTQISQNSEVCNLNYQPVSNCTLKSNNLLGLDYSSSSEDDF